MIVSEIAHHASGLPQNLEQEGLDVFADLRP